MSPSISNIVDCMLAFPSSSHDSVSSMQSGLELILDHHLKPLDKEIDDYAINQLNQYKVKLKTYGPYQLFLIVFGFLADYKEQIKTESFIELRTFCTKIPIKVYSSLDQYTFGKLFAMSVFFEMAELYNLLLKVYEESGKKLRPDFNWIYTTEEPISGDIKLYCVEGPNNEYWGKSMLYYSIEANNIKRASFFIKLIINDDRYHVNGIWKKEDIINLGYMSYEACPYATSPVALAILKTKWVTDKSIVKELIENGGRVEIHDSLSQYPEFQRYIDNSVLRVFMEEREWLDKEIAVLKGENAQLRKQLGAFQRSKRKEPGSASKGSELDALKASSILIRKLRTSPDVRKPVEVESAVSKKSQ